MHELEAGDKRLEAPEVELPAINVVNPLSSRNVAGRI
jgi:hypothetical protein